MARRPLILLVVFSLAALSSPAGAHVERPAKFPPGLGSVPTYRTSGPLLLVCKGLKTAKAIRKLPRGLERRNERWHAQCQDHGYRNLQAAIDHVKEQGSRIKILPGRYRELPTAGKVGSDCAGLEMQRPLSYEDQYRCPHVDNLVSIFGDSPTDPDQVCDLPVCNLQIEGTGKSAGDVIVDGGFHKLNAIRADRADGIYFRNFTVQNTEFNSLYVLETDGYVFDKMVTRWNEEYGFLSFASDHGLYTDCEAYGNGDGGLYPGSSAPTDGNHYSTEITGCRSHHNLLGYSATAGNNTYVHDNWFYDNTVGIVTDSFAAGHPGMPQKNSRFENNFVYSNNEDFYKFWRDGTCKKPQEERGYENGTVCPTFQAPIGVGILIAGGNNDIVKNNWIYDNWRNGTMQFGVPATFRGDDDPAHEFDTSHNNRYEANYFGALLTGPGPRNGVDIWWDGQGTGNCWKDNIAAPGRAITTDTPTVLPDCDDPPFMGPPASPKQALIASCAATDPRDPETYDGCDWYDAPPKPS
jgi:hypothetical protein